MYLNLSNNKHNLIYLVVYKYKNLLQDLLQEYLPRNNLATNVFCIFSVFYLFFVVLSTVRQC